MREGSVAHSVISPLMSKISPLAVSRNEVLHACAHSQVSQSRLPCATHESPAATNEILFMGTASFLKTSLSTQYPSWNIWSSAHLPPSAGTSTVSCEVHGDHALEVFIAHMRNKY